MTSITVISDTHSDSYDSLPEKLRQDIAASDAVVHAGDFGNKLFYESLKNQAKKLYAVKGNNDIFDLPVELVFIEGKIKIALMHGDRARGERAQWLEYYFANDKPDLIIFGHTHVPYNSGNLFNPGSPTRGRSAAGKTYGKLLIDGANYSLDLIKL